MVYGYNPHYKYNKFINAINLILKDSINIKYIKFNINLIFSITKNEIMAGYERDRWFGCHGVCPVRPLQYV